LNWTEWEARTLSSPAHRQRQNQPAAIYRRRRVIRRRICRFLLVNFSSLRPLVDSSTSFAGLRPTPNSSRDDQSAKRNEDAARGRAQRHRRQRSGDGHHIDDYDLTSEALTTSNEVLLQLRDHVRLNSPGLYIWAAGYLERTSDPLMKQLLLRRSGFALAAKESLQAMNVRTVGLPSEMMPQGRSYLPRQNRIDVVQSPMPMIRALAERINTIWQKRRSRWVRCRSGTVIKEAGYISIDSCHRPPLRTAAERSGNVTVDLDVKD
jgi:hypothetical protein